MRFGGPVFGDYPDPEDYARAARAEGYSAIFCSHLGANPDDATVRAFAEAATAHDLVISEGGNCWSTPLSDDSVEAKAAFDLCCRQLDVADQLGARCCPNISGSRGAQWDGPHEKNLTEETFDLVVETTRKIIDAVQPKRTYYALETMPWMYPDSVDSYVRLVEAMDRERFGVHFDPVNLICSPQRYYANAELIRDFVARLGPHIRSCHAKDVALRGNLTTHLDEVQPGLGNLDYHTFLREVGRLEPEVGVIMEHMGSAEEYRAAAKYIRGVAAQEGVAL
jgi:sugar phosphate isomerase/epimerase